MQNQTIHTLVKQLSSLAIQHSVRLATAESCTGGGVATAITELAGSSDWFECGFVTYSNQAKHRMLGVAESLFISDGAVSEAVVVAMAEGALRHSAAQLSVAISGVAGPGGGSAEKPVGTVWMAWAVMGQGVVSERFLFAGDRASVRQQAVEHALKGFIKQLDKKTV